MTTGDVIKAARLRRHMTQQELGSMVGVQKSAVAKWEKGDVVNIKRPTLEKLSEVLDIDVALLVHPEGNKNSTSEGGMSMDRIVLMDMVKNLPEDKIQMLLKIAEAALGK